MARIHIGKEPIASIPLKLHECPLDSSLSVGASECDPDMIPSGRDTETTMSSLEGKVQIYEYVSCFIGEKEETEMS